MPKGGQEATAWPKIDVASQKSAVFMSQPSADKSPAIGFVPSQLPRLALLPPDLSGTETGSAAIANALIEDLTIGLCASRMVSCGRALYRRKDQSFR